MSKAEKRYVDIRIHFTEEVEEYKDSEGNLIESWTSHDIDYVERKKIKGVTEEDLSSLGESFGQMDSYHIFFQNILPLAISDGGEHEFRE